MSLTPAYATAAAGPPAAASDRAPAAQPSDSPAADPQTPPDGPTEPAFDDTGQALFLITVFAVAALIAVGALWGAAVLDTWWGLVCMMIVHLLLSAVVFVAVFMVLEGQRPTLRRRGRRG